LEFVKLFLEIKRERVLEVLEKENR
jgi:hypothetical protein